MSEKIQDNKLVGLYKKTYLLRAFEDKVAQLFMQGLIPGTVHLYTGEEASAVGVIDHLHRQDKVFLTHRPHGGAIAKGLAPKAAFAEILGRADGCTRGKGGSMHLVDIERGVMPTNPIIGAGIVLANGVAFYEKSKQTGNIAVAFFGDGCSNIGAFHEGVNFAAVNRLPVLFVCENNLYAVSTRIDATCRLKNISDRTSAYGITGMTVDGTDVEAVYLAAQKAVDLVRGGKGPVLLETKVYRFLGHSRTDPATYRPPEEVEEWKRRDPLIIGRRKILERNIMSEEELNRIERNIKEEIEQAAEFAKNSPLPRPDWALEYVYADQFPKEGGSHA